VLTANPSWNHFCSSTLAGNANSYFFEEEEVKADTPRGFRRDGVLHSETLGRARGNKEDTLQLDGCISMSSSVAVNEFLVVVDDVEEPTFEVSGGEISDVSAEEFDDHAVAAGHRTNVDRMEGNLVTCCLVSRELKQRLDLIPVEIAPGILLIRSGELLSSLTCRGDQSAEGWYLVTKACWESSAGSGCCSICAA